MRVVNCKTVYSEIEEADSLQDLGAPAMAHVQDCVLCQAFYDERLKLRQLVASLEAVEAPPDFGFRVRARLASEREASHPRFMIGSLSFGLPSVALATVALLLGAAFAHRLWKPSTNSLSTVHTETPDADKSAAVRDKQGSSTGKHDGTVAGSPDVVATGIGRSPDAGKQRRSSASSIASLGSKRRPAIQEFSATEAPVIKQDDTIASLEAPIFSIEAPSQPLKVSVDYATGWSRTISVPTLSFGSERAITGAGSSLIKTSTKGVW